MPSSTALKELCCEARPRGGRPGRAGRGWQDGHRGKIPGRATRRKSVPAANGLFVWSFYQEPDAGVLPSRTAPLLHPRRLSFGASERSRADSSLEHGASDRQTTPDGARRTGARAARRGPRPGGFGQLEDPLLKGLLTRIAEGIGQTVALVTSRFPLDRSLSSPGQGYRHIDVEQLSHDAALDLLRHHGVRGDELRCRGWWRPTAPRADARSPGGLIGQFLGGDPTKAPEAPQFASPEHDRQALKLARLLKAYEEHLPAEELALYAGFACWSEACRPTRSCRCFCVLRQCISERRGNCQPDRAHRGNGDHLTELLLEVAILFARLSPKRSSKRRSPDRSCFRENIKQAIESLWKHFEANAEALVEEVIQLYDKTNFDVSTELRPLKWHDQQQLREAITRYQELQQSSAASRTRGRRRRSRRRFSSEGWGKGTGPLVPGPDGGRRLAGACAENARPCSGSRSSIWLCAAFARSASSISKNGERAARWHRWISVASRGCSTGLVRRHLVLREGDGSVSVHPAVRDYFGQLATSSEQGFWHQLIGEQLISLVRKPGWRLPADKASLDLVEEAISHAVRAGETAKAQGLYFQVLGGHRHLAWKLGEMARGLRILRGFNPCPDRWAMGWYLRALGELELAYEQNNLPFFRADIRLLQGRLTEVEKEGDTARTEVAQFLMGRATRLPADALGCVIPRVQLLIYLGRMADAWQSTQPEQVYEMIGWEDDRVRCQLFRAEVASRLGDAQGSERSLDDATTWILHSGSVEHCVSTTWSGLASRCEAGNPWRREVPWRKGCTWRGGVDWGFITSSFWR